MLLRVEGGVAAACFIMWENANAVGHITSRSEPHKRGGFVVVLEQNVPTIERPDSI